MGDYLDKVTAADINDDELIIEEDLSNKDKTFNDWFNRVTDASEEYGKTKWELMFHICATVRMGTSVVRFADIIKKYHRIKRNIEIVTDGNCELFMSMGKYLKDSPNHNMEVKSYDMIAKEALSPLFSDSPLFDQESDYSDNRMIIKDNDVNHYDDNDIGWSMNISFVMTPPKELNIRKMLMLFETIRDFKVFVLKTDKKTTCRTVVFRKAETQESKPYWITVDGQTGLDETMNIGHMFLLQRKNKNVPSVSTQKHERDEYYVVFNKIFKHTSADNTWNYKGYIQPALEEFINRS